jgi:hypothetical protein
MPIIKNKPPKPINTIPNNPKESFIDVLKVIPNERIIIPIKIYLFDRFG